MARAKQTARSEARRRYRQATSQDVDLEVAEDIEPVVDRGKPGPARAARQPQPSGRPGVMSAFRDAYRPANVREDISMLPSLLRHWSFLVPIAMIVAGAVISTIWWNYTGGRTIYQLVLLPGSGFGLPQLVAGFFAPRASYLLGLIVSIVQGVAATIFAVNLSSSLGTPFTNEEFVASLVPAFVAGPITGMLFAAAAAWYRRFLRLSSPRRAAATGRNESRSSQRGGGRR